MKKALYTFLLAALVASGADWKITYSVPKTARANFDTTIDVQLADAKGAPLAGADVQVVLTMIDMDHGEFKSPAKAVKPGMYRAAVKFIMVGAWQIEVRAKKGAEAASKKFRFEMNE